MQFFPVAPWSTLLKVISGLSTLLLLAVGYAAWKAAPSAGSAHVVGTVVACLPPAIAFGALLFVVTGYEVDGTQLRVRRLLWPTTLKLEGVSRVWQDPDVIKGSIRIFGNGGLFSFSGIFWSKRLGRYRMFATDLKRSVLLVSTDRVVVVTPADPQAFIGYIRFLFPNVEDRPAGLPREERA